MILAWWVWVATVAAFVVSSGFLVRLLLWDWEHSPTGRALTLLSLSIAILAGAGILRGIDVNAPAARVSTAVGWSLLAVATAWRWALMERSQRRG